MGEDGAAIEYAVGDPVDMTVTGVVKSIDGDMAEVKLQAANGEPIAYSEKKEMEYEDEDEGEMLRKMAMESDGGEADL